MNSTNLLIVLAKNGELGKVKTRLAKSIGDQQALEVYNYLFNYTERVIQRLVNCDVHVYFSDRILEENYRGYSKFVQTGNDLGERMCQAFKNGFELGYERVLGIGTDLPDLTVEIINKAINALEDRDLVFGPATDGGYYLLGMKQCHSCIFENKRWSTENLLQVTLDELREQKFTIHLLESLNDIDTYEDFKHSNLVEKLPNIQPAH